jgi:hypothetical protein
LLREVGAEPTDANIAATQQVYFRAMSEASAISARRQREGRPEDQTRAEAIVLREAERAADLEKATMVSAPQHAADQTKKSAATAVAE